MKKRIFKYAIEKQSQQVIKLPKGAEILTIQTQFGEPKLWALVDPNESLEGRTIEIFGTGHPISDVSNLRYISTFQVSDGSLVFHVFERLS